MPLSENSRNIRQCGKEGEHLINSHKACIPVNTRDFIQCSIDHWETHTCLPEVHSLVTERETIMILNLILEMGAFLTQLAEREGSR